MGWAEELLQISDTDENKNNENLQHSKLKLDTRKWLLAKILHKVYGDRPPTDDVRDEDGGRTIRIIGGLPDE
jgi:hypothetical protein